MTTEDWGALLVHENGRSRLVFDPLEIGTYVKSDGTARKRFWGIVVPHSMFETESRRKALMSILRKPALGCECCAGKDVEAR